MPARIARRRRDPMSTQTIIEIYPQTVQLLRRPRAGSEKHPRPGVSIDGWPPIRPGGHRCPVDVIDRTESAPQKSHETGRTRYRLSDFQLS